MAFKSFARTGRHVPATEKNPSPSESLKVECESPFGDLDFTANTGEVSNIVMMRRRYLFQEFIFLYSLQGTRV